MSLIRKLFGRGSTSTRAEAAFRAGQVWSYRTRPGEEESLLLITRVETRSGVGEVVHVRVAGLRIENPLHPDGFSAEISHMPFAPEAVRRSVTELLRSGVPGLAENEGYGSWKDAFDRGETGIFTLTIAEAVDAMEAAVR